MEGRSAVYSVAGVPSRCFGALAGGSSVPESARVERAGGTRFLSVRECNLRVWVTRGAAVCGETWEVCGWRAVGLAVVG